MSLVIEIVYTMLIALAFSVAMTKAMVWSLPDFRFGLAGQFLIWLVLFFPLGVWIARDMLAM